MKPMPTRASTQAFCPAVFGLLLAAVPAGAITPAELAARLARNEAMFIIDVRSSTAYQQGHIPGAMNIPLGLLPHKQIPASLPVVVYGDGLGVIADGQALSVIRAKPGLRSDVLEGGYAAWMSVTRLTTASPGVAPEILPMISYDQLVAAAKVDMVLVDARSGTAAPPAAAAPAAAGEPRRERQAAAAPASDLLAEFAAKIGVPVVSSDRPVATSRTASASAPGGSTPARAAAPAPVELPSGKLLILVADSEAEATEVARRLRASGNYRFTILVGGTESIRHEGRIGTGRMDGSASTPIQR
jgi:rhodanese-related sulfurtransferase